jgi:cell division protein FtsB
MSEYQWVIGLMIGVIGFLVGLIVGGLNVNRKIEKVKEKVIDPLRNDVTRNMEQLKALEERYEEGRAGLEEKCRENKESIAEMGRNFVLQINGVIQLLTEIVAHNKQIVDQNAILISKKIIGKE